jgi:hypothetical protein
MFTVNGIEDAAPAAPANIFPVEGEDGKYYVIPGSQITLKATAAEGYNVAGWKVGTETIATGEGIAYADYQDAEQQRMPATSTYTFTMTDAKTIAPVFGENEYNVEFAEGTNTSEWTATPNPAKTKQTVTVTYTGTRKVIGVKAEKKAATPAEGKTYTNLQGGEVLHVGDKITGTDGKFRYTPLDNYYAYISSYYTYEVLRANVAYEDYNYKYTESPDGQYYVLKHTYYDDEKEEWVTNYDVNQDLPVTGTSDGITVTLDGQDGTQRNLYTFWVHEPNP